MKYTKEEYEKAIKESFSFNAAHKVLTGSNSGSSYTHFKKRIIELEIDTSHFDISKTRSKPTSRLNYQEVLIYGRRKKGVREESSILRRAMLEYGFKYKCASCNNSGKWMNQNLRLEIDHINNDNIDNRPENLRFLCPNCHSLEPNRKDWHNNWADNLSQNNKDKSCPDCQTLILRKSSYCIICSQKYKSYRPKQSKHYCLDCDKIIKKRSIRCKSCDNKYRERNYKIDWDCTCVLIRKTSESSFVAVAKELGVSDSAVRKRIEKHPCNH